jgi:succinate semialdehyde reductase (NADPH)
VPFPVELQLDAVVHEAFAPQSLVEAGSSEQVNGSLLEHPGSDSLLDVLAASRLENHRLNSAQVEQVCEEEPRRPGTHDSNLRSHVIFPCFGWVGRSVRQDGATGTGHRAVSDSMLAAVLPEPGVPFVLEQIPIPRPRLGEILVRVNACGVCHTDLHVMKGEVAFPTPAVLGHEISGTVVELGDGVEGHEVGSSVIATFIMPCGSCTACLTARDDLCERFFALNRLRGTLYDGETRLFRPDGQALAMYSMAGLAEYSVVPATAIFPRPPSVPVEEAAILGCAALTAYGAVSNGADLRLGERVAVVATGGVGSLIVQFARALGAVQVVAIDVSAEKLRAARELGATHVIDASTEDPVPRLLELTDGAGVDASFEVLGRDETFLQALAMLRDGGRMVAVGIAPIDGRAPIEITRLVRRGLRIIGSYGARPRSDMPRLLALIENGVLHPEASVTRRFSLAEAQKAYDALDRREIVGRAVVVMPSADGATP